jgi:hypothetical protein
MKALLNQGFVAEST